MLKILPKTVFNIFICKKAEKYNISVYFNITLYNVTTCYILSTGYRCVTI